MARCSERLSGTFRPAHLFTTAGSITTMTSGTRIPNRRLVEISDDGSGLVLDPRQFVADIVDQRREVERPTRFERPALDILMRPSQRKRRRPAPSDRQPGLVVYAPYPFASGEFLGTKPPWRQARSLGAASSPSAKPNTAPARAIGVPAADACSSSRSGEPIRRHPERGERRVLHGGRRRSGVLVLHGRAVLAADGARRRWRTLISHKSESIA